MAYILLQLRDVLHQLALAGLDRQWQEHANKSVVG